MVQRKVDVVIRGRDRTRGAITSARGGLSNLASGFTKIAGVAAAATAAVGVFAGARGLARMVRSSFDTIDQTSKMADALALTTEQLVALQQAAKITGVEQTQLNTAMSRFLKNLGDAQVGLSSSVRAFDLLGVSAEEVAELETFEAFKLIADRLNDIPQPAQRAQIAMQLFGRAGISFQKTVDLGSEGIERFRGEVSRLGLAFDREAGAKVELANDALTRMKSVFQGLANTIAIELAPFVQAIAERFIEASTEGEGMGAKVVDALEFIAQGIGFVGDAIASLQFGFIGLKTIAIESINAIVQFAAPAVQNLLALLNHIPGVNTGLVGSVTAAASLGLDALAGAQRQAFEDFLLEPLPSDKIQRFFDDVRRKSDEAARDSLRGARGLSGLAVGVADELEAAGVTGAGEQRPSAARTLESRFLSRAPGFDPIRKTEQNTADTATTAKQSQRELEEQTRLLEILAENPAALLPGAF